LLASVVEIEHPFAGKRNLIRQLAPVVVTAKIARTRGKPFVIRHSPFGFL